ncbi:MAG: alpha/beta hydrolase [Bacteroidota bacterium]
MKQAISTKYINSHHMKSFLVLFLSIFTLYSLVAQDIKVVQRPQEPKKPYPYFSEDVMFQNQEAKISLSGTLTLPKNKNDFPVVVLISGSSPYNRNEEIAGHKPFLVIADHLTRNGIGVLRYDDRGVGQSEGKYEMAAYTDRTGDVESAIAYLRTRKDISKRKIGLIGHSEGGLIAPRVASRQKDISFIVLLAAPAIPGYDMILLQTETRNKARGISDAKIKVELAFLKGIFDVVIAASDLEKAKSHLADSLTAHPEHLPEGMKAENVDAIVETFTAPWFQNILRYNPGISLENVKCPVLAINGGKDLQIPPKENLDAIKKALKKGGNEKVTIKKLPNLNHLFQEAETGLPDEFSTIEQTFSPIALKEITNWIRKSE